MEELCEQGQSFAGKVALVTGCGPGSIGSLLVEALLSGGATVVATTSNFSEARTRFFRRTYERSGGAGSRLLLVPFNQASSRDVAALVRHLYARPAEGGLGLDVDIVAPFAAVSENGRDLSGIDGHSEFAHRLMATNLLRLLGEVRQAKQERGITSRPALALLPLSPNHGVFGNDGLCVQPPACRPVQRPCCAGVVAVC